MIKHKWMLLFLISSSLFFVVVDVTVLYTILPTLSYKLKLSSSEKLWVINIYPLVTSGLLPVSSILIDYFGCKKILIIGLIIFALSSFYAAFSLISFSLIFSRFLLAIGASLIMPTSLSIVRYIFVSSKERSFAFGIWSSIMASGAAIGPLIGGFLLKYFWWGSVFLVNFLIVFFTLPILIVLVPNFNVKLKKDFDFLSSILVFFGILSVISSLKELSNLFFSFFRFLFFLFFGFIFIFFFILRQRNRFYQMIDFLLFKDNFFSSGFIIAITIMSIIVGLEFSLSQILQLLFKLTPLKTSFYIIPIPFGSVLISPFVGFLLPYYKKKTIVFLGFFLIFIGIFGIFLCYKNYFVLFVMSLFVVGFGSGFLFTITSYMMMINVPIQKVAMAASLESIAYELGSVLGGIIFGGIMTISYSYFFIFSNDKLIKNNDFYDSFEKTLIFSSKIKSLEARFLMEKAVIFFENSFNITLISMMFLILLIIIFINRMLKD